MFPERDCQRSEIERPGSSIPSIVVLQVSPAVMGWSVVSVQLLTISPA